MSIPNNQRERLQETVQRLDELLAFVFPLRVEGYFLICGNIAKARDAAWAALQRTESALAIEGEEILRREG